MPRTGVFHSYCQKMPQQCLELGPSSVTVKKCLNNSSNWGHFLSYCQKMTAPCSKRDTSFHFPSEYLQILRRHTPTSSDSWQRVHRKVRKSAPRFLQFLEHWRYYVTLLQLMFCHWYYYHCLFLRFVHEQEIRSGSRPARGRVSALPVYIWSCEIRFSHTRCSPTNLHQHLSLRCFKFNLALQKGIWFLIRY